MAETASKAQQSDRGDDLQAARTLFPHLVDEARKRAAPANGRVMRSLDEAIREPAAVFRVTPRLHD